MNNSDLVVELNRTIMICEYNLRRKNINFDVGVFGDVINDTVTLNNLNINLFVAFVGPDDLIIDKWSKSVSVKLKNQKISSFSLPIEGLRSKIEEEEQALHIRFSLVSNNQIDKMFFVFKNIKRIN